MSNWYKKTWMVLAWVMVTGGAAGPALGQEAAAAEAPSAQPQRVMISSGLGSEMIAARRPDDAVWLDLDGGDTALALFRPEQSLPARGALLMLADEGQSAASELLAALGKRLSARGWGTMTLGLEAPPYELQQAWKLADADLTEAVAEPEAADGAVESVMIDVMEDGERETLESRYRARIQATLAAASANLQERGYDRVVLVSAGAGAIHLARFAAGGNATEMVWVTPRFYPHDEPRLVELLAGAGSLALLDLYSSRRDSPGMAGDGRAIKLKKAGVEGYQAQPVGVAAPAEVRDAGALAGRIRSWLASM